MNRLPSLLVVFATLTSGCSLERGVTGVGPTTTSSVIPSLIGTWKSASGQTSTGSSCTNLQLRIVSQTSDSVSGEFSADCVGNVNPAGSAFGQLGGKNVSYQVTGTTTAPGVSTCPFSLSGTATIDGDSIRMPYSGTTCLGTVRGEDVLRKAQPAAPAPAPTPAPPAPTPVPAPGNSHHVPAGPLTVERAQQVGLATQAEFPALLVAKSSDAESLAAGVEFLRRVIWHLQLAGFQAGRQRNPSNAISGDKLTVFIGGAWHAYDIFRTPGSAGVAPVVDISEVSPANHVADDGIPD